ncbi:translation initiation factor 3, RNA-binding subunit [Exidia glandulosa HHB12029]|uniref:Eukaryotic translation initiation factor 3 subunit G n=1 Tax=Exidia glandulosa HHB12029 TaxID=1314781 RepID=A0A166B9Q1_EXIGL|nr:translation initiation factor 3, RNA-binding subunit [Exidia glandulosa HHB12029]
MATETAVKTSWADDVEDELFPSKPQETVDENGVRTIVEYYKNDDGKTVTKKIKRVLQKVVVNHTVAERKQWAKFGAEKGNKAGPDRATTTIGEAVSLKLSAGNKTNEQAEDTPEQQLKLSMQKSKIVCRICQGDHFTAKCPYKDSLGGLTGADTPAEVDVPSAGEAAAPTSIGGKYVPPSMRAGAGRGAGESMFRGGGNRDDLPTLRVTNVSEDTSDNDLRDLFSRFGRVARVYIGRDRDTGVGKGYAFVSFEDKAVAERAMQKVHGMGYDNLILNCQWSQPREARAP